MVGSYAWAMLNDPPWSCIPLADRLYLIYLEAGMRRFPRWMLGTLYEALDRFKQQGRV
jgi:hypothetical protein